MLKIIILQILLLFNVTAYCDWQEKDGQQYFEFTEQDSIESKFKTTNREPIKNTPAHSKWKIAKNAYIKDQLISAMVLSAPSGVTVMNNVKRNSSGGYTFTNNSVSNGGSAESFFDSIETSPNSQGTGYKAASIPKKTVVKSAPTGDDLVSTADEVTTKKMQTHFCKTDKCRENVEKVIMLSADLQTRCELVDNKIGKVVKSSNFKKSRFCESHFSLYHPIISALKKKKLPGDFSIKYKSAIINEVKFDGRCEAKYLGKTDSSRKPGWGSNIPDEVECLEKCEKSFSKLSTAAKGDWVGLQCIWGTKVVRILGGEPTKELCELVDRTTNKVVRSGPAKSAAICLSRNAGSNSSVVYQLQRNDEAGDFSIRFNNEEVGENVFQARCKRLVLGLNDSRESRGSGPIESEKACLDSCHATFDKATKKANGDWRGLTCMYGQKTLITLGGKVEKKLCELKDVDDNNKVVYTSNNSSKEACMRQTAASNTVAVYVRQKDGMPGHFTVHFNGELIGENKFDGRCTYTTLGSHHYHKTGGSSPSPDKVDCLKKCEESYKRVVNNTKDEWRGVECSFGKINNGEGIHLASFGGSPVKKECEFIDNETNTSLSKVQTSTPSTCKSRYSGSNPAVIYKKRRDGIPGDYIVKWDGKQIYQNKFGARCISESIGTRSGGGGPSESKETCLVMCKERFDRVSKNPPKNWEGYKCYFGQTDKSKGTLLKTFSFPSE
jgi:hypothetical protein